jgi:putative hydrolase of the HAD superfamily
MCAEPGETAGLGLADLDLSWAKTDRDTNSSATTTPRLFIAPDSSNKLFGNPLGVWFLAQNDMIALMSAWSHEVRQNLLIDADDTLWENNIYFESAIADFISFLNHRERSRREVREILNDVERESIVSHGYGLHSFAHALVKTFERLSVEPLTPALHETIQGFAHAIAEQPLQLLPEVRETLESISERHVLFLVTKGDLQEQTRKVECSGLKRYFCCVEILPEKNVDAYRSIVGRHKLSTGDTWMVGNSPKSDINPALRAGMNAVFVPHGDTWILEHEELTVAERPRQLLVIERFLDLKEHF